jgi:hypothetical protein
MREVIASHTLRASVMENSQETFVDLELFVEYEWCKIALYSFIGLMMVC